MLVQAQLICKLELLEAFSNLQKQNYLQFCYTKHCIGKNDVNSLVWQLVVKQLELSWC